MLRDAGRVEMRAAVRVRVRPVRVKVQGQRGSAVAGEGEGERVRTMMPLMIHDLYSFRLILVGAYICVTNKNVFKSSNVAVKSSLHMSHKQKCHNNT